MSEAYAVPGNALLRIDPGQWAGQTFSPRLTHVLEYIDLELMRWAEPWRHLFEVYICGVTGLPTGAPISTSDGTIEPPPGITYLGRHRFRMTPVTLYQNWTYAIVVHVDPADPSYTIFWQYEQWTGTYSRGERIFSNNDGVTWFKYPTDDHIFAEFGDPPLATPDPAPPVLNFAIVDLTYTHWDAGLSIRFPTSVPCHLTMYWTDEQPLKHHTSRIIRGLEVPWGTYFCFVAWHAQEQDEEGDTLWHTFQFTEWPACPPPPPTNTFINLKDKTPFWEPWGTTLTENYHWLSFADPLPPDIDLSNGILALDFTHTPHSGIRYNLIQGQFPLKDHLDQPLHLLTNNTEVVSINPFDNIVNMVNFRKNGYYLSLYLNLKSSIAGFGSGNYGYELTGDWAKAWLNIPTGVQDINLLDYFQRVAADVGWDTSPDGWYGDLVEIAHADPTPLFPSSIKNDYICLYHPFSLQRTGRFFTFRGQVDSIDSPSVGPIFQHCHPGIVLPPLPLRPDSPGDYSQCYQFPWGTGQNWDKVAEVTPDEDDTYVTRYGGTTGSSIDSYNFTHLSPDIVNITSLIITVRVRRIAQNPAGGYPTKISFGFRIDGVNYFIDLNTSSNIYFYRSIPYTTNPSTGLKWTRDDIATIQSYLRLRFINRAFWEGGLISGRCTQIYIQVIPGIKGGPD